MNHNLPNKEIAKSRLPIEKPGVSESCQAAEMYSTTWKSHVDSNFPHEVPATKALEVTPLSNSSGSERVMREVHVNGLTYRVWIAPPLAVESGTETTKTAKGSSKTPQSGVSRTAGIANGEAANGQQPPSTSPQGEVESWHRRPRRPPMSLNEPGSAKERSANAEAAQPKPASRTEACKTANAECVDAPAAACNEATGCEGADADMSQHHQVGKASWCDREDDGDEPKWLSEASTMLSEPSRLRVPLGREIPPISTKGLTDTLKAVRGSILEMARHPLATYLKQLDWYILSLVKSGEEITRAAVEQAYTERLMTLGTISSTKRIKLVLRELPRNTESLIAQTPRDMEELRKQAQGVFQKHEEHAVQVTTDEPPRWWTALMVYIKTNNAYALWLNRARLTKVTEVVNQEDPTGERLRWALRQYYPPPKDQRPVHATPELGLIGCQLQAEIEDKALKPLARYLDDSETRWNTISPSLTAVTRALRDGLRCSPQYSAVESSGRIQPWLRDLFKGLRNGEDGMSTAEYASERLRPHVASATSLVKGRPYSDGSAPLEQSILFHNLADDSPTSVVVALLPFGTGTHGVQPLHTAHLHHTTPQLR